METSENQRKFICGLTHRYLKRDEKLQQLSNQIRGRNHFRLAVEKARIYIHLLRGMEKTNQR